jgi:hypothetical protein
MNFKLDSIMSRFDQLSGPDFKSTAHHFPQRKRSRSFKLPTASTSVPSIPVSQSFVAPASSSNPTGAGQERLAALEAQVARGLASLDASNSSIAQLQSQVGTTPPPVFPISSAWSTHEDSDDDTQMSSHEYDAPLNDAHLPPSQQ